jgi:hypothetical protein
MYYEWQVVKKFPHIHEYRALRLSPCGDGGAGGYDVKKYVKCQLALSSTDGMYILHTHTHMLYPVSSQMELFLTFRILFHRCVNMLSDKKRCLFCKVFESLSLHF